MRSTTFNVAQATTDSAVVPAPGGTGTLSVAVYGFFVQVGVAGQAIVFNSKGSGAGTTLFAIPTTAASNVTWPADPNMELFKGKPGEGITMTTAATTGPVLGWVMWDYV